MLAIMRSSLIVMTALFLSVQVAMADDSTNTMTTPPTNAAPSAPSEPTSSTTPATPKPPRPPAPPVPPAPILGTPATPPADKSKFEIILLVGQSNMAGRAPLTDADKQPDPRVLVLNRLDQWYNQGEPIHYDKPQVLGVGPGFTFAKLLADKEPGVTIGLVPCAYGGTTMAQWDPKAKGSSTKLYPPDNLYDNAIRRAKIAMQSGTLVAILWHQGESDAGKGAETYAARLTTLAGEFRTDLGLPNVPFIAGEIGYFGYAAHPLSQTINQQIDTLPTLVPNSGVASADGLTDKGDHLHFSNESQKTLAQRYLDAYLKVRGSTPPVTP
jgi:hypothetical protein